MADASKSNLRLRIGLFAGLMIMLLIIALIFGTMMMGSSAPVRVENEPTDRRFAPGERVIEAALDDADADLARRMEEARAGGDDSSVVQVAVADLDDPARAELDATLARLEAEAERARALEQEALRAPLGESVRIRLGSNTPVATYTPVSDAQTLAFAPPPVIYDDFASTTPVSVADNQIRTGQGLRLNVGTLIPVTLTRGFNTEVGGQVHGMLRRPVFDSEGRGFVLLPAGSQAIGRYETSGGPNARRVFIAWSQIRRPDGTTIQLEDSNGVDLAGVSGVEGQRQGGLLRTIGTAFALNLVSGPGLAALQGNSDDPIASAIRDAAQGTTQTVGDTYLRAALERATAIRVEPGARINIELARDLLIAPWTGR